MNFPFLAGDVTLSTSYGVYISQPIRFARVSSHVDDFDTRYKILNFSDKDIDYYEMSNAFSKFYPRHFDLVSKYYVGLKTLLLQDFWNLHFMATWCINSEK